MNVDNKAQIICFFFTYLSGFSLRQQNGEHLENFACLLLLSIEKKSGAGIVLVRVFSGMTGRQIAPLSPLRRMLTCVHATYGR